MKAKKQLKLELSPYEYEFIMNTKDQLIDDEDSIDDSTLIYLGEIVLNNLK